MCVVLCMHIRMYVSMCVCVCVYVRALICVFQNVRFAPSILTAVVF